MYFKDKYEYYNVLKKKLLEENIGVTEYKEINYGLQFSLEIGGQSHLVRVFESKKNGVRGDLSIIKEPDVVDIINKALGGSENPSEATSKPITGHDKKAAPAGQADIEETPLIGTDESGKGDYFGPLVIAGVYADQGMKMKLRELGADDSKKLSDTRIAQIAAKIKEICKFSVVVIGNPKYNELYSKIGNLNKLLAWGHARVIENILNQTECGVALSDQFGNPQLIENALMGKGKKIVLEQRPRAEENVAVAAASILARCEFVERIKALSKNYNLEFTKGVSGRTIQIGRELVKKHGKESLSDVAKLHFKTTDEIISKDMN